MSFDVINALVSRVMTASTATLRFPGPTYNDRSSIVRLFVHSLMTFCRFIGRADGTTAVPTLPANRLHTADAGDCR